MLSINGRLVTWLCGVQLDPQEAQIAALKRELFLLRQENVWLRDQVSPGSLPPHYIRLFI